MREPGEDAALLDGLDSEPRELSVDDGKNNNWIRDSEDADPVNFCPRRQS